MYRVTVTEYNYEGDHEYDTLEKALEAIKFFISEGVGYDYIELVQIILFTHTVNIQITGD